MGTSSIVLDKGKEGLDLNKCQKSGSLVSIENGCIRIIEAAKIRNNEVYERLTSSSLERIKVSFCQPLGSCPSEKFCVR